MRVAGMCTVARKQAHVFWVVSAREGMQWGANARPDTWEAMKHNPRPAGQERCSTPLQQRKTLRHNI